MGGNRAGACILAGNQLVGSLLAACRQLVGVM